MTGKFSDSSFTESRERLSTSVDTLNRHGNQNAEALVDSAKDYVYRCLNSDVDSVFALLVLLKNKEVIACSKLLRDLLDAIQASSYTQQPQTDLQQDDLDEVEDLLDEMLLSGKGHRDILSEQLDSHITRMVRSNTTTAGGLLTGPSAQSARNVVIGVADRTFYTLPSVRAASAAFHRAVTSYHFADFEEVSAYLQTRSALNGLDDSLHRSADAQDALLDIAVATSLVKNASKSKLDIRLPKYEGPVEVMLGTKSEAFGGTNPFIIPSVAEAVAELMVTGVVTEDTSSPEVRIELPVSTPPATKVTPVFTRTESGFLIQDLVAGDEVSKIITTLVPNTATADPADLTTVSPDGAYLKTPKVPIVPGTVRVVVSVKDTVTGEIITFELGDQTDGPYYDNIHQYGTLEPIDAPGTSLGEIHYQTGEITIDTTLVTTATEWPHGDIYCTYEYRAVGTLLNFDITKTDTLVEYFSGCGSFNKFLLICGNYLYEATLDDPRQVHDVIPPEEYPTNVQDVTDLRNLLGSATWIKYDESLVATEVDSPVIFTVDDSSIVVTATEDFAGSANRLRFPPIRAAGVNENFGSPRYEGTPPTYLNSVLPLIHSDHLGADSAFSGGTVTDPEALVETRLITEKVKGGSYSTTYYWDSGQVFLAEVPQDAAVGDDVYETSAGWHTKIDELVQLDTGDTVASLKPQPPLPVVGTALDYSSPVPCSVNVTRNRPRVVPNSDLAAATIEVTDEGLGFSGVSVGESLRVSLGDAVSLTNVVTKPGYNIKKGDAVYEKVASAHYREIGRVGSTKGTTITIVINEGVEYVYPFTDLRVQSIGLHNFNTLKTSIAQHTTALNAVDVGEYRKLCNTFATSGSGHAQFVRQTLGLISTISALRNTYLKYDSHVVNTVNMLLEYLKQEKLTVVSDLLLGAQYAKIPDLTPQEVAGQGDIEAMLEQAAALYGSNTEMVDTRRGFNPLADFVNRGEDTNVSPGEAKRDFSRSNS